MKRWAGLEVKPQPTLSFQDLLLLAIRSVNFSFSAAAAAALIDQIQFDLSLTVDSAGTGVKQRHFKKNFSLVLRNTIGTLSDTLIEAY